MTILGSEFYLCDDMLIDSHNTEPAMLNVASRELAPRNNSWPIVDGEVVSSVELQSSNRGCDIVG